MQQLYNAEHPIANKLKQKNQENTTHNEKEKSVATGPVMTQMIELVDKDFKNRYYNYISYVW